MNTSKDQVTGIIERVIYGAMMLLLGKLVARGTIDGDMAAYIAGGAVTAFGSAYAWWINRPKALVQAVANIPNPAAPNGKTVIITTPELAAATPDQGNIVSSDTTKAVNK